MQDTVGCLILKLNEACIKKYLYHSYCSNSHGKSDNFLAILFRALLYPGDFLSDNCNILGIFYQGMYNFTTVTLILLSFSPPGCPNLVKWLTF